MGRRTIQKSILVGSVALVFAIPASVLASAGPISANIIEITATADGKTGTFTQIFPVASIDGTYAWQLPAPVVLQSGATELAVVEDASVAYNADPAVDLGFQVKNTSPWPAVFKITAGTIVFDPAPNAEARAGASITLTQGAGSAAGASITGKFPYGKIYEARYSTNAFVNTQTVFVDLVSSFLFNRGLSQSQSEEIPDPDVMEFAPLGVTVHMIESQFWFGLSAGDLASGTSIFEIVPEPASVLLLAFGGLLLARRRMA